MKGISKFAFWIGLLLIIGGSLYDVMYAGIPYQDAPTDLAIEYEHHQEIANWTMKVGLTMAIFGGLITIADILIVRVRKIRDRE